MLEKILEERLRKLAEYEKEANPYPARVTRTHTIAEVVDGFQKLFRAKKKIALAGRIFALRDQGKIIFADLRDGNAKMQMVFNEAELKKEFKLIQNTFDMGDFVEVLGTPFLTKRGEKSILVKNARIVAKSLRPLPTEWYGIEDIETKLRKRFIDLALHDEVRELFIKKSAFWNAVREFVQKAGYMEVETPVLELLPGGAEAEPFKTHHNALNTDFYLRISLELPLKKLLVGGYEKVFEIGRIFRNEGIDRDHLQDYTQMECYAAYEDYNDMMKFTEELYKFVIKKTLGTMKTTYGETTIDWSKKWKKVDYFSLFKEGTGLDLSSVGEGDLREKAKKLNIQLEPHAGKGRLIDLLFKKTVRGTLLQPCFLIDPPIEIEPLAKRSEKDPKRVERFQIMAGGTELGKGFSELNDPVDQRKRFEEQMKLRAAGDKEAQRLDEDFLEALEYGMPPAAGFGMSERLFAVLLDKPVRETVFFPLMRPKV